MPTTLSKRMSTRATSKSGKASANRYLSARLSPFSTLCHTIPDFNNKPINPLESFLPIS